MAQPFLVPFRRLLKTRRVTVEVFDPVSTRVGSGYIDPHFLDLGTSWRWVVSFTPRPLYPRGKGPRYPLDRRLSGPQSQSGRRGEEKILDHTGTGTPTPGRPARSQSLYRLSYPISGKDKRFFSTPQCLDRLWDLPSLLSNCYRGVLPRDKVPDVWSWLLTTI
jgi:hypothetical protein